MILILTKGMNNKSRFSLIVAMGKSNRGIGSQNGLPWKIKEDMDWFKKVTTSNCGTSVLMGRNTWESIPKKFRPLPDRNNIILSSKLYGIDTKDENVKYVKSIHEALSIVQNDSKLFVIGGQKLYEEAINMLECDELYITEVDDSLIKKECDTFFPEIPKYFKETSVIPGNTEGVTFKIYKNISDVNSDEMQYINTLKYIIDKGEWKSGRNGRVVSVFGDVQHKFDLTKGFPLLTTKRMPFDLIIKELLFFIRGDTNAKNLSKQGVKIWDGNTTREFLDNRGLSGYNEGDMGPMYGWNWRHFGAEYKGANACYLNCGFDQLSYLINCIVKDPSSRRLLLTTYDPSKVEQSVLAPCHGLTIQFNVSDKYLDCKMYQRSVDTALGYPFNIASYAAFVHVIAKVCGLKPRWLYMTLGDTHLYEQHLEKVKRHFDRIPLKMPTLQIKDPEESDLIDVNSRIRWMEALTCDDFKLENYNYYPGIKMDMVA